LRTAVDRNPLPAMHGEKLDGLAKGLVLLLTAGTAAQVTLDPGHPGRRQLAVEIVG